MIKEYYNEDNIVGLIMRHQNLKLYEFKIAFINSVAYEDIRNKYDESLIFFLNKVGGGYSTSYVTSCGTLQEEVCSSFYTFKNKIYYFP